MSKIRLTKGELKMQRDALRQYERYLPTLQLKKQQLQLEILHQITLLDEKTKNLASKKNAALTWSSLLSEPGAELKLWLSPKKIITQEKNIAGIDMPVFEQAEFQAAEYDLFAMPLWVDNAIDILRTIVSWRQELKVIERGIEILREELRITSQRVNLFEKVKIPQTKEAIRLIKIYLGDQMANAVGRSKIAKQRISELTEVSLAA